MRGGFPLSLRLIREMHAILLRRARAEQEAGRVPPLAELDRRHAAGQRPVRAAAAGAGRGCIGASSGSCTPTTRPATADQGGPGPCPVRDHPSLPRRQRPGGPPADHAHALCEAGVLREPMLYLSLYLQDASRRVLSLVAGGAAVRCLGSLAGVLPDRVAETATQAADTARELMALFEEDRGLFRSSAVSPPRCCGSMNSFSGGRW